MALDWLPIDPLQPPRCRLRSKADTVAPSSAASIAVPDVLMSLTFLAAQPAAPRRRRQLNVREWVGPFMDGVRPATWLPVLRPRLPLRRLARGRLGGETFDPPPSVQVVVAQALGWTPTLLDRLMRRRLRPTEAVYVTPPALIALGVYCTELVDDAVTTTDLSSEAVTASDLTAEAFASSTLVDEALC